MRTKSKSKSNPEAVVRHIKPHTRRKFSSEEKIRIVLEGLRGEDSVADPAYTGRREGINPNLYYRRQSPPFGTGPKPSCHEVATMWEAGKKRLNGDTQREANLDEVSGLRHENQQLKEVVADQLLKNRLLKKSLTGWASE